ncbi:hypothetical protein [Microbacterium invictum]|uniref:Secreted protein n=1 Tax=Microbacterium invictum TaxID=515415 RepID=A0ABZ0VGF1_9MICO|nr:hypothetical protein [Microbacterium invictum]WQB70882.1 hypothetical protein T9R20_02675 [Microbacterium invictum]
MKISRVALLSAAGAISISLVAGPAQATTETDEPPTPEEISAEIASIESSAARDAAQDLYEELVADGHVVGDVATSTYVPVDGDEVQSRSYPTDCGMTVFVSRVNNIIYNNTTTGCNAAASSIRHQVGITGRNPFNSFDSNEVRNVTYTAYNTASANHGTSYACENSNQTNWVATSYGTLVRNGVTYETPGVYDIINFQDCGW